MSADLTLLCPGLLEAGASAGLPPMPALERLLARADRKSDRPHDPHRSLWQHFGLPEPAGDIPIGAITSRGLGAPADDGFWFCADPVHLVADRDRLLLMPLEPLSVVEGALLVDTVESTFGEDGWRMARHSGRFFLRAPVAFAVTTTPLHAAIGRDIDPLLPTGDDRLLVHRFLTELQMLLHTSRLNATREERGDSPVSSLWLWGGGCWPTVSASAPFTVYADDGFTKGLAMLTGGEPQYVPGGVIRLARSACLVVLDHERAEHAHLDRSWFSLIGARLGGSGWRHADLELGCGQRFHVTPWNLRRFWRRPTPLQSVAERVCR